MNRFNRSGVRTIANFVRSGTPQLSLQYKVGQRGTVTVVLDRMSQRRGPAFTLVRFIFGTRTTFQTTFHPSPTGTGAEIQQFIIRFISTITKQPLSSVGRIPPQPRPPTMPAGMPPTMRAGPRPGLRRSPSARPSAGMPPAMPAGPRPGLRRFVGRLPFRR